MATTNKELGIRYTADTSGVKKGVGEIERLNTSLSSKLKAAGQSMTNVGKSATLGLTLPIVGAGVAAFKLADEYGDAAGQVQQHIKTMGVQGVVSFGGLSKAARDFSMQTGIAQTELLGASGKLVTFANVAARGTGFLNETTRAAADLSASGFGSVSSASVMLGKALDNPLKGITALSRVGVSFSEQQTKVIEKLVATGQTAKAQGIILGAVQAQVGGTAKKIADPWDKAKATLQATAITIGEAVMPVVSKLAGVIADVAKWFQNLSPGAKEIAIKIAAVAAAAGPLLIIFGKLATAVGSIVGLGAKIIGVFVGKAAAASADAAATGAATTATWALNTSLLATIATVGLIVVAIVAVAIVIIKNWDTIKRFGIAAWNAIKAAALAVWNAIKAAALFVWNVIKGIIKAYVAAWKIAFRVVWTVVKTVWNAIKAAIKAAWAVIKAIAAAYVAVYKTAWNVVKTIALGVWKAIVGAVKIAWGVLKSVGQTIKSFFVGIWNGIKESAKTVWDAIKTTVSNVWDVISGIVKTGANGLIVILNGIIKGINLLIRGVNLVKPGEDISSIEPIPYLARGGRIMRTGLAIVGESGPELVSLNRGASVAPLERGGGIGGPIVLNLDRRRFGRGLELETLTRGR